MYTLHLCYFFLAMSAAAAAPPLLKESEGAAGDGDSNLKEVLEEETLPLLEKLEDSDAGWDLPLWELALILALVFIFAGVVIAMISGRINFLFAKKNTSLLTNRTDGKYISDIFDNFVELFEHISRHKNDDCIKNLGRQPPETASFLINKINESSKLLEYLKHNRNINLFKDKWINQNKDFIETIFNQYTEILKKINDVCVDHGEFVISKHNIKSDPPPPLIFEY